MTPPAYFNLLRNMPIFGGLNDETLTLIVNQASPRVVESGDYFFHEGDGADSLFVLESGIVIIERRWKQTMVELNRLKAGDCIGEMALIDLLPRSATARAAEDCQAIEITLRALHELYKQELEQYAIIMMNMGREVSRRLRRTDDRLLALEQKYHRA